MSLANFIAGLSNPIDDKQNISQLLDEYVTGISYEALVDIYRDKKVTGKRDEVEENKYYVSIFNEWKNSILSLPKDKIEEISGRVGIGFKYMYQYLKSLGPVRTRKDVENIFSDKDNEELDTMLKMLNPFTRAHTSWTYITNNYIRFDDFRGFDIKHRIYLNIDSDKVFKVANSFRSKCEELNLSYEFKFDQYADRADSMVIYCSDDNLTLFVKILELIRKENKDLVSAFHEPPVATGVYQGWLGYGEEPSKGRTSYNIERAPLFQAGIGASYREWAVEIPKRTIQVGKKNMSYLDYIVYQLYKDFMFMQRDKFILGNSMRKATPNEVKLYNSDEYCNKIYSMIKKYVYDNKVSLTTLNSDSFSVSLPMIVGKNKTIDEYDCERVIRKLYKSHVMGSPALMDKLRASVKSTFKSHGVSSRVVVESSTLKELQDYQSKKKQLLKVVKSRPMGVDSSFKNMYQTLEKAAGIMRHNLGKQLDISGMVQPLLDSFNMLHNTLQHRFSGSSEDYDERTVYYLRMMAKSLINKNLQDYEHYKSLMFAYDKLESRDKKL